MNIISWKSNYSDKVKDILDEKFANAELGTGLKVEDMNGWEDDGDGRYYRDVFIEYDDRDQTDRYTLIFEESIATKNSYELFLLDNRGNDVWSEIISQEALDKAINPKKSTSLTP